MARIVVTKRDATKKNGKLRKGCRRLSGGGSKYSCPSSVIKPKGPKGSGRFKKSGGRH